jgi:leucyl-tRNA synthetase
MYEMFMGPLESDKPWDTGSVIGVYRLLQRIHTLVVSSIAAQKKAGKGTTSEAWLSSLHQTIKKVGEDIEGLKFNTAIAAIMILINAWESLPSDEQNNVAPEDLEDFIKMLAPFAPFLSEMLYQSLQEAIDKPAKKSVHETIWPAYQEAFLQQKEVNIVIQVNGKLRGEVKMSPEDANQKEAVIKRAQGEESTQRWLADKTILKTIFVPGKLVNFVVSDK